jgi:hypothetical protein
MKITSKLVLVTALALGASAASLDSSFAMPAPQRSDVAAAATAQDVGWRCGPGWRANGWGRCVPNRPWRRGWRRW